MLLNVTCKAQLKGTLPKNVSVSEFEFLTTAMLHYVNL